MRVSHGGEVTVLQNVGGEEVPVDALRSSDGGVAIRPLKPVLELTATCRIDVVLPPLRLDLEARRNHREIGAVEPLHKAVVAVRLRRHRHLPDLRYLGYVLGEAEAEAVDLNVERHDEASQGAD